MLLEASGLDFVSILKGLGWILGRFWVVSGMDFRGFWTILDCSDILRYWGVLRRSWEVFSMLFGENIEKRDLVKISVSPRQEQENQGFDL